MDQQRVPNQGRLQKFEEQCITAEKRRREDIQIMFQELHTVRTPAEANTSTDRTPLARSYIPITFHKSDDHLHRVESARRICPPHLPAVSDPRVLQHSGFVSGARDRLGTARFTSIGTALTVTAKATTQQQPRHQRENQF